MANIWFAASVAIFVIDFVSRGDFAAGASMINVIYPAVLTIYVGQKEIMRWQERSFRSRFGGENIVLIWTALMITFVVVSIVTHGAYRVSLEMALTYVAVMGIYAVSVKSKELRSRRRAP